MISSRKIAVLLAFVCLAWVVPAQAWDEAKGKETVQVALDQVAAALAKKDLVAANAGALPEATIKYTDGRTLTMAQWQAESAKQLAKIDSYSSKFEVEKVWPKGKGVIGAVYKETETFTLTADPKTKHQVNFRFRTFMVKTDQGWRFREFVQLSGPGALVAPPKPKAKPAAAPK